MLLGLQRFVPVVLFGLLALAVPSGAATTRFSGSALSPPALRGTHLARARRASRPENVLYEFDRPGISNPTASLIADSSGTLYGTAGQGGNGEPPSGVCADIGGCGGIFKLTPVGSGYTETTLYEFTGGADGAGPFAELYMDASGALYGTATYNGSTKCPLGCGTVFKLTPFGSEYAESTLYDFQGGTDGANPTGGLIADSNGSLYGTTQEGGDANNDGTVFRLTRKGKSYEETILHRFGGCSTSSAACDGANPFATLYMDSSGTLFSTTTYGGKYQCPENNLCGTVFRLTPKGRGYKEDIIYYFKGGNDGATSQGGLIADSSGALYGATVLGGGASYPPCNFASTVRGCGTVFKLTPDGKRYKETVLHRFQGYADGANPQAGVIADASGDLYGTTQLGGNGGGCGTVFKLAPDGQRYKESILYAFVGCAYSGGDADAPRAGLLDVNKALYGTSFQGGDDGWGTVFSVSL